MIHLHNAPIFLEFLTHNLKNISKDTIVNNFYISGKCNCNQSDCSTVILKKRKNSSINEENLQIDIKSLKGMVDFHWLDDEYLEIEAICYKYPFKYEINRLFPKSGRLSKTTPFKVKNRKIKARDKKHLKQYLKSKMSLYEKKIYDGLDYRATRERKLFAHKK